MRASLVLRAIAVSGSRRSSNCERTLVHNGGRKRGFHVKPGSARWQVEGKQRGFDHDGMAVRPGREAPVSTTNCYAIPTTCTTHPPTEYSSLVHKTD